MNIYPWAFEEGDVVETLGGNVRLLKQVGSDNILGEAWDVHNLDVDIELVYHFPDREYKIVEVKG